MPKKVVKMCIDIFLCILEMCWRICIILTIVLLGVLEYYNFVKFCIEHEISGFGFDVSRGMIMITIISGMLYFAADWKYVIGKGNYTLLSCMRSDSGKVTTLILLHIFRAIFILIFAYTLASLLFDLLNPFIVVLIAAIVAISFSIMAFRYKPRKETSDDSTEYNYQKLARHITSKNIKQFITNIIAKRFTKNIQNSKQHEQIANGGNYDKATSHNVSQKGKV